MQEIEKEGVMNRVIFVGFDDEKQAYEGDRALREMHRDGSITLYADAVIAKKPNGEVVVRERAGEGPVGTAGGLLTGSLIGLLGGPLGVAVGATAGTAIGAAADLTRAGIGSDFLEDVGEHLLPGKAAVIAEIDEQWQLPLRHPNGVSRRHAPSPDSDADRGCLLRERD